MPHAENTVTIDRPIEDVFAYLADGTNNPHWRSGVVSIERASGDVGQRARGQGLQRGGVPDVVTGLGIDIDLLIEMRAVAGVIAETALVYVLTGSICSTRRVDTMSANPIPMALPRLSGVRPRT